ncbi:8693_t:CDS:1, partial [Dentiscutata erythropus]
DEVRVLIEGGALADLKPDPSKKWGEQSRNIQSKLISDIIKKLPAYRQNSAAIEKILKQHHKTQRRTATINANPALKKHNRERIDKNSKVND